jgi:hypothetical protein
LRRLGVLAEHNARQHTISTAIARAWFAGHHQRAGGDAGSSDRG